MVTQPTKALAALQRQVWAFGANEPITRDIAAVLVYLDELQIEKERLGKLLATARIEHTAVVVENARMLRFEGERIHSAGPRTRCAIVVADRGYEAAALLEDAGFDVEIVRAIP